MFLKILVIIYVYDVCVGACMLQHTCKDQRTTLWNRFSPPIFSWVLGSNSVDQACTASTFIC